MSWKSKEELDKEYYKRIKEIEEKVIPATREKEEIERAKAQRKNIDIQKEDMGITSLSDSDDLVVDLSSSESLVQENQILETVKEEPALESQAIGVTDLQSLLNQAKNGKKKERLSAIDSLSSFLADEDVIQTLIHISRKDSYHICRAKAVSILADKINQRYIRDLIIEKLSDSSKEVRKWAIWGLKGIIQKKEIQDALIRHLLYQENSKEIKMWVINALSPHIDNEDVEYAFLKILNTYLSVEIRELIINALLSKINDPEVVYSLSKHLFKEPNKDIKKKIIKAFKETNNPDAKFTLERLLKVETDKEILSLL